MRPKPDSFACTCERLESRLAFAAGAAANPPLPAYDLGSPTLTEIWVDPTAGKRAPAGACPARGGRTPPPARLFFTTCAAHQEESG